jgi:hypothetical protein
MKYPNETDEMANIRDEIRKNCRHLKVIAECIDSEFVEQDGDTEWEIGEARELLNTIEQQISDYDKLNVMNERLRGIGV